MKSRELAQWHRRRDPEIGSLSVRVDPLFPPDGGRHSNGGVVTFEPGARTRWHTHPAGQTIIITQGLGWVQRDGGPVEEVRKCLMARPSSGLSRSPTRSIQSRRTT
jgi:quercetin dioxygenase-like cupin family protein